MFAALAEPAFRRYAAGVAASNIGTWMHRVGQAWLVLQLTGDATVLGVTVGLQFLPMLVVGPFAGVLADRTDRRRLLMATQTLLALQALALGVAVIAGWASAPLVLVAALLLGILTAVDAPARQSIVSDLVQPERLVNAVSLNSASFNAARLIGPAFAGLIIAAWGTGWVFVINAGTFAATLLALATIGPVPIRTASKARGGVLAGVAHIRQRPDLLYVIVLAGVVSLFVLNFQMTTAIMATDVFGADARVYGVLGSVMAVGSLVGSLLAARRGSTSLRIVTTAAITLSASTVVAGLMPGPELFAALLALCGFSALTMMTAANSYLQTRSGPEFRSRVLALYMAVFFGSTPLGAPVIGWMAEHWGGRVSLVIPGLCALVFALVLGTLMARRTRVTQADAQTLVPLSPRRPQRSLA